MSPEDIIRFVLGEFELKINDSMPCCFECDCTRDRVSQALLSVGKKELQDMIDEGKDIELQCHFCSKKYKFTPEEIREMMEKA